MREFHRVLRPHGHLALLHIMTPAFSTKLWKWVGMIGVVTGTNSRMRLLSIFEPEGQDSADGVTGFGPVAASR